MLNKFVAQQENGEKAKKFNSEVMKGGGGRVGGQAQRLVKEISLGLKFWNQLIKMLNAVRKTQRFEFYFLKVSWF